MDTRIKELIDFTKTKFGLDDYYLQTHQLYRNINIFKDTVYTLCMEWFPAHITEQDEDFNPEGTAVIDIDIHSHFFESVIFVGGKTYAKGVSFHIVNKDVITMWVENETGLVYGKQFKLVKEAAGEFCFQECIDDVDVSPSGYIEVHCDPQGRLLLFSNNGHFPTKDRVKEKAFSVDIGDVEQLAREQLKLIEVPSLNRKGLFPYMPWKKFMSPMIKP
ncbi:hypothetical protein [Peribacillus glennii]|uniref:hypothetical protein n=1 Tax=Peribacillus glennii TaxID=2303991 RepID=UPI001F38E043|nr:hypothetical protein [Peribacillus glennii]